MIHYFLRRLIIAISFIYLYQLSRPQEAKGQNLIQIGLTINFLQNNLYKDSGGSLGGGTEFDVKKYDPLPGFQAGAIRDEYISTRFFLRTGGILSYHVNSAEINSYSWVQSFQTNKSENIKIRFRSLYIQLPIELGTYLGKNKIFGIYGGFKGSYMLLNKSKWQYISTVNHYDPFPVYQYTTTAYDESKLNVGSADIALELGLIQRLSKRLILEERVYKGFITVAEFASHGPNLKQVTLETGLAMNISDKK